MDSEKYPCPACGFLVFAKAAGSREQCGMCGWLDDHVQLRFPGMIGGLNSLSLWDWQQKALVDLPPDLEEYGGVMRETLWRPLHWGEAHFRRGVRITGRMYADGAGQGYYWKNTFVPPPPSSSKD